jgi:hypothetical protein
MFLCALVIVSAVRLSSRMSQHNVVVEPGPTEQQRTLVPPRQRGKGRR